MSTIRFNKPDIILSMSLKIPRKESIQGEFYALIELHKH